MTIFYDGGGLDYITERRSPDGLVIDPWEWPDGAPGRHPLMNWRGVGDRARLMDLRRLQVRQVIDCTGMDGELHPGEETCEGIIDGRVELLGGYLDWDARVIRRIPPPGAAVPSSDLPAVGSFHG